MEQQTPRGTLAELDEPMVKKWKARKKFGGNFDNVM